MDPDQLLCEFGLHICECPCLNGNGRALQRMGLNAASDLYVSCLVGKPFPWVRNSLTSLPCQEFAHFVFSIGPS